MLRVQKHCVCCDIPAVLLAANSSDNAFHLGLCPIFSSGVVAYMPPDALHQRIRDLLDRRRAKGNLRTLDPPVYDPATLVDFSSNDYLSLSTSSELRSSLLGTLSSSPVYGPASSRLLDGNSTSHLRLEAQLADFFQAEAALLFNSGFDANAGLFACLPSADDVVLYDSLIHASVHDGMRHSRCKDRRPFDHNSVPDLKRLLQCLLEGRDGHLFRAGQKQVFIAVEALYSMDGDLAPLQEMLDVLEAALPDGNGHLIVDEAHSTGLYGKQGRGLACSLGLEKRILVRLHTFGKAMACSGGALCLDNSQLQAEQRFRRHPVQPANTKLPNQLRKTPDLLYGHDLLERRSHEGIRPASPNQASR